MNPAKYEQTASESQKGERDEEAIESIPGVDVDQIDLSDLDVDEVDPGDFIWTPDNELVHEPTGLIIDEDQIDRSPEWRAFNHKERQSKSRVGAPTTQTIHDKGLTTQIDWKDRDAYGQSISSKKRRQVNRLRKWNQRCRAKDSEERNLQFALSELNRMSSALDLPESVQELASVLYRRTLEEDLVRGRSIEGVSTATLYVACRQQGIPRSLDEVTEVSRVEQIEIARTYRYISNELGLEMEPVDPKKYIPRFASRLSLDDEVEIKAKEIVDETAEQGMLSGKSPTGFAAAAIYSASLICNAKRTQKEISEVANVTEVTIRNRYKEQLEAIGFEW